jgi:hypothetical protein
LIETIKQDIRLKGVAYAFPDYSPTLEHIMEKLVRAGARSSIEFGKAFIDKEGD